MTEEDVFYGSALILPHEKWNKDTLWKAFELQKDQYDRTKLELFSTKNIRLGTQWWKFYPPTDKIDGSIEWNAKGKMVEE